MPSTPFAKDTAGPGSPLWRSSPDRAGHPLDLGKLERALALDAMIQSFGGNEARLFGALEH
jgi:hypothetical protein